MKKKRRKQIKRKNIIRALRFNLLTFIVLIAVGLTSFGILKNGLLKNSQNMGTSLAGSCAGEMQSRLSVYETLLSFGADWTNFSGDGGREEMAEWLQFYFSHVIRVVGEDIIDPYAAVDGEIIAANPWSGDSDYAYEETQWYQRAMENDGGPAFTDVYTDVIYDRSVITISQRSTKGDAVLAFDVFPENLKFEFESIVLPEGGSYFLFDSTGTVIFEQTATGEYMFASEEFDDLFESIKRGEHDTYDSRIEDREGKLYGVYYNVMPNGWYSVVTLPYASILQNVGQFFVGFVAVFLILMLLLGLITYRDVAFQRRAERTDETVRVLGNSYYAIYRVDFGKGSYDMIKGSDYVRRRIQRQGNYQELMDTMVEVIEEDARNDFRESFSLESIKSLVKKRVRDFGGDFRRIFGDEYRWVDVRVLFDESLAPEEVVLCFREVNAEKHQQLQERALLEDALSAARQSEKTKQAFFSNMSHDMRTPLNAIIGLSELAENSVSDPEKTGEYIRKIRFSGRHLLELINDILDMSRMEQGKVEINRQEFDLRTCISDCAENFKYKADMDGKKFNLSFKITQSRVMGDPFRITQIMNNLLSNAFKFTKEGDTVELEVSQIENQEYAKYKIIVADTGLGMSQEFLKKLFEPYARETRFSARKIVGTGLGMSIVKNLVEQMEGHIHVESKLGEGTVFTLVLPFETGDSADTAPSAAREASAGEKAGARDGGADSRELVSVQGFSLSGKRVLLAEDNEINMELATEILSMHGVEITQAWNGKEAVERFLASEEYGFDAVLMDMQMPELNGCDAARQIRSSGRADAKSVPILAVTANAFAEDIAATEAAGMDAHISKPIDFRILCDTLEKLMGEKRR